MVRCTSRQTASSSFFMRLPLSGRRAHPITGTSLRGGSYLRDGRLRDRVCGWTAHDQHVCLVRISCNFGHQMATSASMGDSPGATSATIHQSMSASISEVTAEPSSSSEGGVVFIRGLPLAERAGPARAQLGPPGHSMRCIDCKTGQQQGICVYHERGPLHLGGARPHRAGAAQLSLLPEGRRVPGPSDSRLRRRLWCAGWCCP
jgi:hypothetical protein